MLTRRRFLSTSATIGAASLVGQTSLNAAPTSTSSVKRPNILIFMPDQQQGQTVLRGNQCLTPHMDRFSKDALTFPNAYCPTPHCCPSRASFQTGLYPSEHGVFNNVANAAAIHTNPYPGTKYFSQPLRQAGYQLAYSGKWHVGRDVRPEDVGWTNLTPDNNGQAWNPVKIAQQEKKLWQKAKVELQAHAPREKSEVVRPGWGNRKMYSTVPNSGATGYEGLEDYTVVQAGLRGLKKLASGSDPWCLMVSNDGGHDLYNAPKRFVDMYDPKSIVLPPNFRDSMQDKPRICQRMRYQYFVQMTDDEVRQCILHYLAKLTMQDEFFGLLLDELEKTGQAENTLVIYVSDHGDYAGAHGLWAKGIPAYREAYNIPCVIRWPAGVKNPGRQVDALVSTTDFAPTILEAAGISSPGMKLSGRSLLPWLRNESPPDWRDALFSQCNGVELYYTQRIVQTKDHKYVYNGFDFDELYDLKEDPHEMVNLAFPQLGTSRSEVERGTGISPNDDLPWPSLPGNLNAIRRDLLEKMWRFAEEHNDQIFDSYVTTAMAPYGPGLL